ncbi:hypothetical protein COCVIDRAFT_101409, partial [Bipolaris victoriae FI3]
GGIVHLGNIGLASVFGSLQRGYQSMRRKVSQRYLVCGPHTRRHLASVWSGGAYQ